ncbi:hypothetical protein NQ314_016091 [Rhamnusium bicolor]|uniref:Uncharacterized protein n=1 Tax=Rhamnusium bicolor TaxID=1586634 RepID=A0AAV8WXY9_9CUCU|nr:hypothetical protein NQ314_016091 [Rhamnusium bicolor]
MGAFKHMQNLTHLTISSQNIAHLTKDMLRGLDNLTYLNLKHNGINKIEENSFEDLSELNHLILSHNNLKSFDPKIFENLNILETLDLYGLDLDKFNASIFSKQKELKHFGVPTSLIKKKLELGQLTKTFPKLETIGLQNEDKEDEDVVKFMKTCKASGFYVQFSNIYL